MREKLEEWYERICRSDEPTKGKLVPVEVYNLVLARAERAEARIEELEKANSEIATEALRDHRVLRTRAERAEAECKTLREALQWIETKARLASSADVMQVYGIHRGIADTARAALGEKS